MPQLNAFMAVNTLTAAGTSEGATKGWESRSHSLHPKQQADVHRILRDAGFKSKGATDYGVGRYAQTVSKYEHPDGHTATVSRNKMVARENFVTIDSPDDHLHEDLGEKFERLGERR